MTHDTDRLALISQEQEYQAAGLVELRQAVTGLARDVRRLEQEIGMIKLLFASLKAGREVTNLPYSVYEEGAEDDWESNV